MSRCWSSASWRRWRRHTKSESLPTPPDDKKEGFLDKHPRLKMMVSKAPALLYIVLNCVLPAIDVLSDVFTFVVLLDSGNTLWAWSTLTCVFLPFGLKTIMFFNDLVRGRASIQNLAGLVLHFPLVSPLIFGTLGLRLLMIDATKAENAATIERIQKIAGLGSLYESYLESGPQVLVQLHIVTCTGRVGTTQLVSMCSSIVMLSLTSARSFYIQRDVVHSEPSPSPHMLLQVIPWKFFQVVSSVFQWSYVANLKQFIFAVFALSGIFTWICLWAYEKILGKLETPAVIGEESADKAANTSDLKQVIVHAGSVGGQNLSKDEFTSLGESEVPKEAEAEKVNDREAADEEMKTENENNEDDKVRKVKKNVKIKEGESVLI